MHGFAKKKGFPTDDRRWYFVISEFNLFDAEDEYMNDKVQAIFESANTSPGQLRNG